jgi:phospholipase/lecithinase/hemolysin
MMFRRIAGRLLSVAVACGALAAYAGSAGAAEKYPAIYVFGDSLSDAGNDWIGTLGAEPLSPPYFQGHFSNGLTWVEDLSVALKLGSLKPSLLGGHDYAYGGAESGPTLVHKLSETPPDLPFQIAEFKLQVPTPAPNALYVLWIGSNDLLDMLSHTPALTPAQQEKAIKQVVTNETVEIAALQLLGARRLLVLTAPDLGKVPGVAATAGAAGSALSAAFNAALVPAVQAVAKKLRIQLTLVDAYTTMDAFIADPATYGFTNVTDPCWTGSYTSLASGTLCSKSKAAQDRYLFWDHVHPTASAHSLIAATVKAQLP